MVFFGQLQVSGMQVYYELLSCITKFPSFKNTLLSVKLELSFDYHLGNMDLHEQEMIRDLKRYL